MRNLLFFQFFQQFIFEKNNFLNCLNSPKKAKENDSKVKYQLDESGREKFRKKGSFYGN